MFCDFFRRVESGYFAYFCILPVWLVTLFRPVLVCYWKSKLGENVLAS
ncbi:MAG: hypothetical protein JWP79_3257 [Polaromonas sp.]|nr:hypothetical protein [Polaromonas sp.]MDB5940284.1 hypothetical protein [Polaromonas sp.]